MGFIMFSYLSRLQVSISDCLYLYGVYVNVYAVRFIFEARQTLFQFQSVPILSIQSNATY